MNIWKFPYFLPDISKAKFQQEVEFELNSFNRISSIFKLMLKKSQNYGRDLMNITLVSGKMLNEKSSSQKSKHLLEDIMEFLSVKIRHENQMQERLTEIIVNSQEYVMSINNDLSYRIENLSDEGEFLKTHFGEVKNLKSIFLKNLEIGKKLLRDNNDGSLDSAVEENEKVRGNLEECFINKITDYNDSVNRYHLLAKKLIKEKDEFLDGIQLKSRSGFRKMLSYDIDVWETTKKRLNDLLEKCERLIEENCRLQSIRRKSEQNSIFLRKDILEPERLIKLIKSSVGTFDDSFKELDFNESIDDLMELEEFIKAAIDGCNVSDENIERFSIILKENESKEIFLIALKNEKFDLDDMNVQHLNSFFGLLVLFNEFIKVCEHKEDWTIIGRLILAVQDLRYQENDMELFMKDFLRYSNIFTKKNFWIEVLKWLVQESIISKFQMNFGDDVKPDDATEDGGLGSGNTVEDIIFKIVKGNIKFISICYFGDVKEVIRNSLSGIKTFKIENFDDIFNKICDDVKNSDLEINSILQIA